MAIFNSYGIPKPDIHGALGHAKLLKLHKAYFEGVSGHVVRVPGGKTMR
jgi:hypothetical protein